MSLFNNYINECSEYVKLNTTSIINNTIDLLNQFLNTPDMIYYIFIPLLLIYIYYLECCKLNYKRKYYELLKKHYQLLTNNEVNQYHTSLKNHQDIIDDMNYRINKITDTVFPNNDKKKIQRTESNLKNQKYRRSECFINKYYFLFLKSY